MVAVTIYDGAETIGGNKIFVDGGRYGYFLDFGRNFKKYGQYFEEFLKARDTRGLHDPLTLEITGSNPAAVKRAIRALGSRIFPGRKLAAGLQPQAHRFLQFFGKRRAP